MFIHKFVLAIFWGPRAENKGRGPRVEEHKHPLFKSNGMKLKLGNKYFE